MAHQMAGLYCHGAEEQSPAFAKPISRYTIQSVDSIADIFPVRLVELAHLLRPVFDHYSIHLAITRCKYVEVAPFVPHLLPS